MKTDPHRIIIDEKKDSTGQVIGYYLQSDAGDTTYLNMHEMHLLMEKTKKNERQSNK